MAGQIIDPEEYEGSAEAVDAAPQEPEVTPDVAEVVEEPTPTESEIPDKYQGKSTAELAEMHQNLEKLLGRQSQEVGELRRAFDQLAIQKAQEAQSVTDEADDTDFFVDPKTSVRKEVDSHPAIQEARQVTEEFRKATSMQKLKERHPDMKGIIQDNGFQEWVGKSSFRQNLFVKADQAYDYEAADELFSLWKERADVVQQTKQVERQVQKQEIKRAATGSMRANPDGQQSKKVYRRADIRRLMQEKPDVYAERADEFLKAYAENRVR